MLLVATPGLNSRTHDGILGVVAARPWCDRHRESTDGKC